MYNIIHYKPKRRYSASFLVITWLLLLPIMLITCTVAKTTSPGPSLVVTGYPDIATSKPAPNGTKKPIFEKQGMNASLRIERINQLDPVQYASTDDANTWMYSTCSAASMTETINSYGHRYKIADILKVETGLQDITPNLGLVKATGIDETVTRFGFQAQWLSSPSVDDLIRIGNSGHPVIIDFPPNLWDGGHILVVKGGDTDHVFLVDSSSLNMKIMAKSTFLKYWAGWAVVVTPK